MPSGTAIIVHQSRNCYFIVSFHAEIDSEAGQIERFDTLEGSRQWIDLGRPSAVSGQEGRKRVRREEDSNEDMSKYKKTSITKKPTSLVKSKPQLLPLKSTTTVPYSGGGVSSSSGFDHGDSGLVSASGSTVTGDGTSFFAPEDVTLPPNSTTDVSITAVVCARDLMLLYFLGGSSHVL